VARCRIAAHANHSGKQFPRPRSPNRLAAPNARQLTAHFNASYHAHGLLQENAMRLYDLQASKRPVNVTLNSDLVARARAEGLNVSALAEEAVAAALGRVVQKKFEAEIAQACRAHEQYLAEYGSLRDAIRTIANAAE
jgi:antitoxin CcdA